MRLKRFPFLAALLLLAAAPVEAKKAKVPAPVGEPFSISSCADCREGGPLLAGNADGRFFAVWSDEDFRLRGRLFDVTGEPGPVLVLAEGRSARLGSVAARPDGDFQVAWLWPNQVHVQRFGASSAGSAVLVSSAPSGDDHDAWMAVRPDGSLILMTGRTFGVGSPAEVRSQLLSAEGTPLGPAAIVDTPFGPGAPVACALPDGGAAMAWARLPEPPAGGQPPPTGLAVSRLMASGSPENSILLAAPPGTPTWSLGHTVACAPGGSFAVAWHTKDSPARSGSDVVVELIRPEANGLTARRAVLSAKGEQADPALLAEPGGWLAVWSSFDKGKSEIRGRRVSPSGKLLGREFVLHKADRGRRADYPALARAGELLVLTWVEDGHARGRLFKP